MRICHLTSGHGPTDGRIFQKMLRSLSSRYEVMEVAPNVNDTIVDGIPIYGVPVPANKIKKLFGLKPIYEKALELDADIYHIHEPELIPWALKLQQRGKKIIFDSHEDTPMQILGMTWIPSPLRKPFSLLYSLYESSKVKHFDAVVSVTPAIVDRLKRHNPNTYLITNYPIVTEAADNRTWGKSIAFAGGVSEQWMHEHVIAALGSTSATYRLAGKATDKYIEKLRQIPGWEKVDFLGLISSAQVFDMLQTCSAGIALNDYVANVGYHQGSLGNTKLFEYMMAGIPVIATDFVLWKEIIETHDCGRCVNPHDTKAIEEAINFYMEHPETAKRQGDNGMKAAKELFCWPTQEKVLFEMYEKITASMR